MGKWIKPIFGITTVIGLWVFSFFQGYKSWNGVVYNNPKNLNRQLASISSKLDLSNVVAIYPEVFEKQNITSRAYIVEKKNIIQIYLGHISTDKSVDNLVCANYSHLQLTLQSADISINGEPLEMKLTALCNVSKNINFINPINLPVDKIKKASSNNFKNDKIYLKNSLFLSMSSDWSISEINFFSKKSRSSQKFSIKIDNPFEFNIK